MVHPSEAPPIEKPAMALYNPEHQDEPIKPNDFTVPAEPVSLPPFEQVQQGPIHIPSIYSGSRTVVYAIIHDSIVPKEITLRATADSGEKLELVVPIVQCSSSLVSKIPSGLADAPLLHTLAARKLLADLEDGRTPESTDIVRAKMVRLGITYNLASKHTSFVAVEADTIGDNVKVDRQKVRVIVPTRPDRGGGDGGATMGTLCGFKDAEEESDDDMGFGLFDGYDDPASSVSPLADLQAIFPGNSPVSPSYSPIPPPSIPPGPSAPLPSSVVFNTSPNMAATSFQYVPPFGPSGQKQNLPSKPAVLSNDEKRALLIRLQAFNGCFPSLKKVCAILDIPVPDRPSTFTVDHNVWATSIALAWLSKKCQDKKSEWELVADKAENYVASVVSGGALLKLQSAASAVF